MEKKSSPTQLAFSGSVNLYRDDLDDIIKKLAETSKAVIIEDNEYRYDSLDEVLEKQGPNPKQLSINSREPFVILNIRIKRGWTTLGTSGDGDNLAPYFYIKQILESRKRKGLKFILAGPPFTLMFLIAGVILASTQLSIFPAWFKWLLVMLLLTTSVCLETLYNMGSFTVVSLKKKHEQESFWVKNKDTIVVGLIMAIVSSLLTFLVAYLLFRQGIK